MFEDCDEQGSKEFQYLNLGQIWIWLKIDSGFPGGSAVKNQPALQEPQETWVRFLGWEDPLEEGMATHSSILAWRIPCTKEPGGWVHRVVKSQTQLKRLNMHAQR